MYAENLISTPEAQADFYPTPKELGKKMLQGIDLGFISTVLEPSAGKGDLIRCLAEESIAQEHRYNPHTLNVDAIEIDPYIRSILKYEFGSARQQEIQHTLCGFEDRTRYDYKLDKEVGLNDEEKTARAQLRYESSLRDRIDLHIVHDDFLTFVSRKTYDLILMNPPFSAGCEHLLKAIELLKCCGGKIRCLLNAETVRNPYSAQRQLLQQYLEEYGAEVEILADAFKDAERQTDVTVALVRIDIPRPTYHSEIYSRLKEASNIEQPQTEATELTLTDFLENIVQQFNFETDVGIALIREYLGMRPYLMESIPPGQYSGSTLVLSVGTDHRSRGPHINDFLRLTRRKYWNALFHNDKFMGKLTSELRQKYYDMVGKLVNYDFTLFNIQQISLEMNAELSQGIQDTIFKLFERFTVEHSWYPETSKNVHYFNGWKANKAHKVNSKIILPVNGMFSDYSWSDAFEVSHAEACISDIEKVFDFLDGNMTSYVNLHGVLARAARAGQTRNIPCKYFDVTLYKKGTMHIRFHNEELLERFNIYCSRGKNWLPPNYGKRTYADMPQEEQAVIDSFHGNGEPASGKERYAEILAKRDYYLQAPKQDFPLLTN